jgi:hypothetical protein
MCPRALALLTFACYTMTTAEHPITSFFTSFAAIGFTWRNTAHLSREWRRLRRFARWNDDELEAVRTRWWAAVADEFQFLYGTDLNDLGSLQRLCGAVGIHPAPETVPQCKKVRTCVVFFQ